MNLAYKQFAIVLIALCAFANAAHAHKVNLFATLDGDKITGKAYFSNGEPVVDGVIRVSAPENTAIGETNTDQKGEFTWPVTAKGAHTFSLELEDGHAATFTVVLEPTSTQPVAEAPLPEPTHNLQRMMEAAVSRELIPLRKQIDAYEQSVRLRDIIGGIGYIVGVFGLVAWLKARNARGRARD